MNPQDERLGQGQKDVALLRMLSDTAKRLEDVASRLELIADEEDQDARRARAEWRAKADKRRPTRPARRDDDERSR